MTQKTFMIYRGGTEGLRLVSGPVKEEDLQVRLATVRNCYANAPVHVTRIVEEPYQSYLPKCVESGNCSALSLDSHCTE